MTAVGFINNIVRYLSENTIKDTLTEGLRLWNPTSKQ